MKETNWYTPDVLYRDYLDTHPDVTFALVDHITSPGSVLLPVKEIARVCRERGVRVMVDGAHSPGQIPLNLPDLEVDYFTGKWKFCYIAMVQLYGREHCL